MKLSVFWLVTAGSHTNISGDSGAAPGRPVPVTAPGTYQSEGKELF